jgi:hypothetical protein
MPEMVEMVYQPIHHGVSQQALVKILGVSTGLLVAVAVVGAVGQMHTTMAVQAVKAVALLVVRTTVCLLPL